MLKFPICILLALASSSSQAFSFVSTGSTGTSRSLMRQAPSTTFLGTSSQQQNQLKWKLSLSAESTEESSSSSSSDSSEEVEQVEAEITDDEPTTAATEEAEGDVVDETVEEEEEVGDEPKVDPEITALKQEIAQLESQLKQKNRDLNNVERIAEDYTKGGYARKVAEMETYRNSQSAASKDNKTAARSEALKNFLPILERLQEISAKYEADEFAKAYGALCWDFNNGLKNLGVTEFHVQEGDNADYRVVAVAEEHSDTFPKGTVIKSFGTGYELSGNLMRAAPAVVSLGPEPVLAPAPEPEPVVEEESSEEA